VLRTASQALTPPIMQMVDTCSDAIRLIKNNAGLPPGSSVAIRVANDQGLALLAEAMTSAQHPPINLNLSRNGYNFTAAGLKHIAPLPLISLSLRNAKFLPQDYEALAKARYGIGLDLAKPTSFTQDIPGHGSNTVTERTPYFQSAISLRSLVDLRINNDPQVSGVEMAALARHPALRSVAVTVPVPALFRNILANPRIKKLIMDGSELGEARFQNQHVFQGLRTHPALNYLSVNLVNTPELFAEIAGNVKIDTLKFRLSPMARISTVRYLAKMPALRQRILRASAPNIVLHQANIVDICQKPLLNFQLRGFKMDESAMATAVRAQAKDLILTAENMRFSSADIDALCSNKAVNCLLLGGHILAADAARLAASPTLISLTLALGTLGAETALRNSVAQAWSTAGKPLDQLRIAPLHADYTSWID